MPVMEQSARAIGVGYEGRDLSEFIEMLRREGVELLVDVRLTPISRKRGFSKTALGEALTEAGIGYEHMRHLGNPKWNRAGFGGSPGELSTARDVYSAGLSTPETQECLERIVEACRLRRVAVMCFEADQRRCHRDLVLSALGERFTYPLSA
ncbi:DUF488 domain-containing protein [Sphaerisporangium sp. NPDC005288]|uniref:DUF488 domain-containing protein n=1 Tax=Sphaerisporangium sp. NPDC005288 TaxID=3155114 RepID=UPI0033B00006